MKNLLILVLLLLSININAQSGGTKDEGARVSFSLYQDPSLAFFEDDYGNKPFTPDVRFEFMMEGRYDGLGSFLLGLTSEYADLSEFNFARFGFQLGYNFRNQTIRIGNFETPFFDYSIYGGAGMIMRNFPEDNQGYMSLELTNEIANFLTDWLSVNAKATLMQRGDLEARYGDSSGSYRPWDWRFNGYIGLKFYLGINK